MLGTDFPCADLPPNLPEGLPYWMGILGQRGFRFQSDGNSREIIAEVGNVKLHMDGSDVALIADEVFGALEYGLFCNNKTVVVDIGMNVGTTSLYFAAQASVIRVIGFEPCKTTLRRAARNLELNPRFASKVEIRPYALGASDRVAKLVVDKHNSGVTRISDCGTRTQNGNEETVEVHDVETEVQNVIKELEPRQSLVLKVDCEGAEVEIFDRLSRDALRRMDTIFIEWHSREILAKIQNILNESGFSVCVRRTTLDLGTLCAFQKISR